MPLTPDQERELELLLLERERRRRLKAKASVGDQLADSFIETGIPVSAGVAGGLLGSPAGPVGAGAGGALGYASGQSLANLVQRLRGKKKPLTDIGEAVGEVRDNVAAGLAGEITGQAIGDVAKPIFKATSRHVFSSKVPGKMAGVVGEVATGVKKTSGERLFNDPTALYSKSVEKAGKELGAVRENLGMIVKKSNADVFAGEASVARKIALDAMDAIDRGEVPDAPYLLRAVQAVDDVIEATPAKQVAHRRDLFQKKEILQNLLSAFSGEEREASRQYGRSVLGSQFRRALPVTKSGDVSLTRSYLLPSMQGTVAGAVPAAVGILTQSPFLWGTAISTAGMGFKAGAKASRLLADDASSALYRSLGFVSSQKAQKRNNGGYPISEAFGSPKLTE